MLTKIAVLVSGGGSNLQALLDEQAAGRLPGGNIYTVISSKEGATALHRAQNAGVEHILTMRPEDFSDRDAYGDALIAKFKKLDIGLVILAGFLHILPARVCTAFRNRIINVHPSLIPAFCGDGFYGLRVHRAVLDYGVKLTGATVHFVNEVTDGGPIILQDTAPVLPDDTPESLQKRVMEQCEWRLLPQAAALFCAGRLSISGNHVIIKDK